MHCYPQTYCVDRQTADSACSATAYLTGVKANYATIGVNGKVRYNDCKSSLDQKNHVSSIMDWAQKAKKATGIVTTTRITHASPAGAYAKTASRDWECDADMIKFPDAQNCRDIALQLIRQEPGRGFNVIYGGGRSKFISEKIIDEEGQRGQRLDGLDLIDEWLTTKDSPKAHYIHNCKGLNSLNTSSVEHVLGLFEADHLKYHLNSTRDDPQLRDLTVSAIEVMKKNPNGFVLFVEGGRIDHGHHDNLARHALEETVEFSEAVRAAMEITDVQDTLIVVTADHAHTMTISGYSSRGKNILGINTEVSDKDGMGYATLNYANGPSAKPRGKPNEHEMGEFLRNLIRSFLLKLLRFSESNDYKYPSMVPLSSETHGGEDVAIYARGPFSHLFTGVLEQNTIPHFMAYAACLGDGLTACNKRRDV